jgi:TM2 domain-containing membrane protein YozV
MMLRIILIFILFSSYVLSQQIDFHSPQNVKLFADFLFCGKDYLRAIEEYEKYLITSENDTVQYKIAYGFLEMESYQNSIERFSAIKSSSSFYEPSKIQKLKAYFLIQDTSSFNYETDILSKSNGMFSNNALKFKNCSFLLTNNLPLKNIFLMPFNPEEKIRVSNFYDWKKNPPYKSELLAGTLSTIIPGAGKIYTQNYADGVTAFILTGLFGYLAYTNFKHDHDFRAWVFTGLAAGFYTGNIYGSVASAQIFNAKINFEFNDEVKLFLENNNYFAPVYDFCK